MGLQVHEELRPYGPCPRGDRWSTSWGPKARLAGHTATALPPVPTPPPERRSGTLPPEPECCFRPSISSSRSSHASKGPLHLGWTCGPSLQACSFHLQKGFTLHLLTSPGLQLFLRKLAPSSLRLPPAGQRALPAVDFVAPEMSLGRGSFGLKG